MKVRHVDLRADEFLAGILGELSPAELGVYWMICLLQYSRNDDLPFDVDWLRRKFRPDKSNRLVGAIVERLIAIGKVYRDGPLMGVRRCREEVESSLRRIHDAAENGRRGGRPSKENKGIRKAPPLSSKKLTTNTQTTNTQTPSISSLRSDSSDEGFSEFYDAYPRHEARRAAERAWKAALKRASRDEIVAGAKRYAALRQGEDKQFTKLPATWLNGDCWADGGGDGPGSVSDRDITPEERRAALVLARQKAGIFDVIDGGEMAVAR